MRRLIPFRAAAITLLLLFGAAALFQFAVLAGLIPIGMVWGGRLQGEDQRIAGALVTISVLVLAARTVRVRMAQSDASVPAWARWGMWSICAVFALNTIGNLLALDLRETLLFTPVTFIAAVLAARVAAGE